MNGPWADRAAGGAAAAALAASLVWLWTQAPWAPLWPQVAAGATVLAALVVWVGLVPGRASDGVWALVPAAVWTGEALAEYLTLPVDTLPYRLVALALFLGALAYGGYRGGWRTGLRWGLAAALWSVAGSVGVFTAWLGQPLQAAVLDASGDLARFAASKSTDFLVWTVADQWSGVPLRVAAGAALGAGVGWLVGRLR